MPDLQTKNFGQVTYDEDTALEFPTGLPGFDECRRFLALQFPDSAPLVFLQSLEDPGLCFLALPVLAVDPEYQLSVAGDDLELIGLDPGRPPRIGTEVLCLAIVSLRESGPTANLLAPVVVNLRNRRAVQAVAPESSYSHQHELTPREEAVCS